MNEYQQDENGEAPYSPLLARLERARQQRERAQPASRATAPEPRVTTPTPQLTGDAAPEVPAERRSPVPRLPRTPEQQVPAPEPPMAPAGGYDLDDAASLALLRLHLSEATIDAATDGEDSASTPVSAAPDASAKAMESMTITPLQPVEAPRPTRAPESEPATEPEPAALRQARSEIERLHAQVERAQSELAGVRRRGERDKADSIRFAAEYTIAQLLPIVDDMERAAAHVPTHLRNDPWVAGVIMIGNGLQSMLERQGVERIVPHHAPFDPHRHEAVSKVEDATVPENTVVEVYRPGYTLHGRVLRPAQVRVAVRGGQS